MTTTHTAALMAVMVVYSSQSTTEPFAPGKPVFRNRASSQKHRPNAASTERTMSNAFPFRQVSTSVKTSATIAERAAMIGATESSPNSKSEPLPATSSNGATNNSVNDTKTLTTSARTRRPQKVSFRAGSPCFTCLEKITERSSARLSAAASPGLMRETRGSTHLLEFSSIFSSLNSFLRVRRNATPSTVDSATATPATAWIAYVMTDGST